VQFLYETLLRSKVASTRHCYLWTWCWFFQKSV